MVRSPYKPHFAEFFGTALLIILGDGSVAQMLLSNHQYGDWISVNFAWAAAIALSSLLSSPGPTLNPAVTVVSAIFRPKKGNDWKSVPGKVFMQMLGGFVGAAIVYVLYYQAIDDFEGGTRTLPGGSILSGQKHHSTAGIFATYPASFINMWTAVFSEFLASAVLMFGLLGIGGSGHPAANQFSAFLLLMGIGTALGWETGYSMNIARDLGPRVFTYLVGYSSEVFTVGPNYFLIPAIVPFIGCAVGAFCFDVFFHDGDDSADWVQALRRKTGMETDGSGTIHLE